MVLPTLHSFLTRQLLRYRSQLRNILSRPIQNALGRPKLIRKPTVKLANKTGSIYPAPTIIPKLHPRKRVAYNIRSPFITPKRKVKSKSISPDLEKLSPKTKVVANLKGTSFEPVLTLSITDLYHATQRALSKSPRKDVTNEDKAMLEKLRKTSFKHDTIAGVKAIQDQLDRIDVVANARWAREHDATTRQTWERRIVARQLLDEQEKRAKLMEERREKLETKKLKGYLEYLVEASRQGKKLGLPAPPTFEVNMWSQYETKWKDILNGKANLFPFEYFPWPTLNLHQLELEDYEKFLISPFRPGYEKLHWYERVDEERPLWDAQYVKEKVLPFVEAGSRSRVARGAAVIRGYMDKLVEKYT